MAFPNGHPMSASPQLVLLVVRAFPLPLHKSPKAQKSNFKPSGSEKSTRALPELCPRTFRINDPPLEPSTPRISISLRVPHRGTQGLERTASIPAREISVGGEGETWKNDQHPPPALGLLLKPALHFLGWLVLSLIGIRSSRHLGSSFGLRRSAKGSLPCNLAGRKTTFRLKIRAVLRLVAFCKIRVRPPSMTT